MLRAEMEKSCRWRWLLDVYISRWCHRSSSVKCVGKIKKCAASAFATRIHSVLTVNVKYELLNIHWPPLTHEPEPFGVRSSYLMLRLNEKKNDCMKCGKKCITHGDRRPTRSDFYCKLQNYIFFLLQLTSRSASLAMK